MINARDDPFVDDRSLPTEAEHIGKDAPVRLVFTEKGGHCGFLAHSPPSENGWLAEEMARAMSHIDTEYSIYIDAAAPSSSSVVSQSHPIAYGC